MGRGQAFDVAGPSQTLAAELARMRHAPRPGMSALVPGCGRAYDALALARHGFDSVVAIDLAPTACEAATEELQASGDPAAAAKVIVQCGDFFEFEGQYDFIWDCTFLCALDPSVRQRWAAKQAFLLAPGGRLLTCVFPICEKEGGPPFAMSVPLVRGLLAPEGLSAARVLDALPPAEQHRPGGGAGLSTASGEGPGTALIEWRKPEIDDSKDDEGRSAGSLGCC